MFFVVDQDFEGGMKSRGCGRRSAGQQLNQQDAAGEKFVFFLWVTLGAFACPAAAPPRWTLGPPGS
jgi:hypothetical protein